MPSAVTTHVLDTATGRPAKGVPVVLEHRKEDVWEKVGEAITNEDGRALNLAPDEIPPGVYRISFDTAVYFDGRPHFHPLVRVVFNYLDDGRHYHVPLLLSPFGYSTYRGS